MVNTWARAGVLVARARTASVAKRVRRLALRQGGPDEVRERADHHFSMPITRLAFAVGLREPLYVPKRSASK